MALLMKSYINGLIIVLQFFSVLPIKREVSMTSKHLERAVRMFSVFGLMTGAVYASVAYGLMQYTPLSLLAVAFVLWFVTIIATGGIHLDGWMDTSDAFFSYRDKKKRLSILKDPQIGAFGVLSVIVLLSAKFLFIYETLEAHTPLTFILIGLIPFYSRIGMGMMLILVSSAKSSGLGVMFQKAGNQSTLWSYLPILILVLLGMFIYAWPAGMLASGMLAVTLLLFYMYKKKVIDWFGGMNGDIIGAFVEGVEVFLWMVLWLLHFYA